MRKVRSQKGKDIDKFTFYVLVCIYTFLMNYFNNHWLSSVVVLVFYLYELFERFECKGEAPSLEVSSVFCRSSAEKGPEKFDFYRKCIPNHEMDPNILPKRAQCSQKHGFRAKFMPKLCKFDKMGPKVIQNG